MCTREKLFVHTAPTRTRTQTTRTDVGLLHLWLTGASLSRLGDRH